MASHTTLMIGLPFSGHPVRPEFAVTLAFMDRPLAFNYGFTPIYGKNIDVARNAIAALAQYHKAKYVFFLDDDVTCPKNTLPRLTTYMEQPHHQDVMVIGGIYCSKQDPPVPLVFKGEGNGPFWDWKAGDVFEVDGLATGCMLIRTEIFDKLKAPWFLQMDLPVPNSNGQIVISDDLYFCMKVREAGFKIMADGGVLCEHWDIDGKHYELPVDSFPLIPRKSVESVENKAETTEKTA